MRMTPLSSTVSGMLVYSSCSREGNVRYDADCGEYRR